jgi:hypothetical protein
MQIHMYIYTNRRERDEANVTNDDVFRRLHLWLIVSPWENPRPLHIYKILCKFHRWCFVHISIDFFLSSFCKNILLGAESPFCPVLRTDIIEQLTINSSTNYTAYTLLLINDYVFVNNTFCIFTVFCLRDNKFWTTLVCRPANFPNRPPRICCFRLHSIYEEGRIFFCFPTIFLFP